MKHIYDNDGEKLFSVRKDGTVADKHNKKVVGKIDGDKIIDNDGKIMYKMSARNKLVDDNGEEIGHIRENNFIYAGVLAALAVIITLVCVFSFVESALLIIIGVLLFELIIFIHELGHFMTAKASGVKVNEFALGMGPRILRFKKGETIYSLRLLPIGGFCAMEGEDEESDNPRAFGKAACWKRIIIVVAGAVMNIVLGFILMMITLMPNSQFASTTISKFHENATTSASLKVGDEIVSINGYRVYTSQDLSFSLVTANQNSDGEFAPEIAVRRNGETVNLGNVKFGSREVDGKKAIVLDFYVAPIQNNFWNLIAETGKGVVSTVRLVWASLFGLITGRFGFNELAGPIGMTSAISQVASAGLQSSFGDAVMNIVSVMMMITVNLGVVNLLPLPALDGGRLVFLIIELIRRKPVSAKYEGWVHAIGMIVLLAFMALISFSDILRLFTGTGLGG